MSSPAAAKSHKLSEIDAYCKQLQASLTSATPFVFSGPDPWIEIDDLPTSMPDEAVAYVYATGAEIRWVFIRILDEDHGLSEDISYFYRDDGTIAKRVRQVESTPANIVLEVTSYFEGGQLLKEISHHHGLKPGRQDSSQFTDPDAPVYWTTDELPFPDILDLWHRLA